MTHFIHRAITKTFQAAFGSGKIIILYGSRQSGKTTFVKSFLENQPKGKYFQCEQSQVRDVLVSWDLPRIMSLIGDADFVIFDEAQIVEGIGNALKILHEAQPKIQIIVVASSSFDLQKNMIEPLTWRHRNFILFPFLYREVRDFQWDDHPKQYSLEDRLLYGSYYDAIFSSNWEDPKDILMRIAENYALKDILFFSGIRKLEILMNLLKVLAYQIGQEVSYGSIAKDFGMSIQTIESYIKILEKAFIVFRLPPYNWKKSSGIKKMRKVYFWDTGLRNALINNFAPLDFRPDRWALFENFFISEYAKKIITFRIHKELSFWRSYTGTKIDLMVEVDGETLAYDVKWKDDRHSISMSENSPVSEVVLITKDNYMNYL